MRAAQGAQPPGGPGGVAMANAIAGSFSASPRPSPQPPPMPAQAAVAAPIAMPAPVVAQAPVIAAAPVAAPAPPAAAVACPQCGQVNSPSNKFCASCGYNMALVAASPAAAPGYSPGVSPGAFPVTGAPPPGLGGIPSPGIFAAQAPGMPVLTALRADGTEAGTFALTASTMTVGRDAGGIFAGDSYLSPRHATFFFRGGKLFIKDELSLNGVYMKLMPEQPYELQSGEVFRIGQEIIRFELLAAQPPGPDGVERLGSPTKGYIGRISLVTGRDTTGNAYPISERGLHVGRERGEILFPEDGYVSGLHCRISAEGGRVYLTDLGSSNGTFARVSNEREVRNRDVLLMGQQLFRVGF
jgi:pSer/pThr/pTyr-binding forkhead associated (FHA) protein